MPILQKKFCFILILILFIIPFIICDSLPLPNSIFNYLKKFFVKDIKKNHLFNIEKINNYLLLKIFGPILNSSFKSLTQFDNELDMIIKDIEIPINWNPTIEPNKKFYSPLVAGTMLNKATSAVVEWIEFHLIQKFDYFIIIDDNSPNLNVLLEKYIANGQVIIIPIKQMLEDKSFKHPEISKCKSLNIKFKIGEYKQNRVAHCQRASFNYIANLLQKIEPNSFVSFFDIDEFMYIEPYSDEASSGIIGFLDKLNKKHPCALIRFLSFGTSFNDIQPEGLITENYRYHAPINAYGTPSKPIAIAKSIKFVETHHIVPKYGKCVRLDDFPSNVLLGNHYQYPSRKYWLNTFFKRRICRNIYNVERENFLNACQCPRLDYYLPLLKTNLGIKLNEKERAYYFLSEIREDGFISKNKIKKKLNLPKLLDPNTYCNDMIDPISKFPPYFIPSKCTDYEIRTKTLADDFIYFCLKDTQEQLMKKVPILFDGSVMNNQTYGMKIYQDYQGYFPFNKDENSNWNNIANYNMKLRILNQTNTN